MQRIIDAPVINEERRGAIEPRVVKTRHAASDSPGENMKRVQREKRFRGKRFERALKHVFTRVCVKLRIPI